MKGREPLEVDPQVFELCLSSGLSSGEMAVPRAIGDRILRLTTFIHAHRTLSGTPLRRNPHGPA
jgi:hypothetical protein